jgi:hypothetical protein
MNPHHRRAVLLASGVLALGSGALVSTARANPIEPPNCATQLSSPGSGAALAVTTGPGGLVTLHGQAPAGSASPSTYRFDFGDGTVVTQGSTIATHTYAFNAAFGPSVAVSAAGSATATSPACMVWVDTVAKSVHRYAGGDRYGTGAAISQWLWADASGDTTQRRPAQAVVLASGEGFADALAGVPLAAYKQGPLLLTEPNTLTKATEDEIKRVLQRNATVYLLGGTSAVSPAVAKQLLDDGYQVVRYGGADRYATSMQIATQGLQNPESVVVVTGLDYPDALAAGPVTTGDLFQADGKPAAILLSEGRTLDDPATKAYIRARLGEYKLTLPDGQVWYLSHVLAVGGQATCAVWSIDGLPGCADGGSKYIDTGDYVMLGTEIGMNPPEFGEIAGPTRYATAAGIQSSFVDHTFYAPGISASFDGRIGIASGTSYADALTGGAAMAVLHARIELTERDYFPAVTASAVDAWALAPAPNTFEGDIFGGPAAVSPALEAQLNVDIRR